MMAGLIIAWQIYENFINDNLYAQRIDPYGRKLWAIEGVKVCDAPGIQKNASIASDGNGGIIAVWSDERDVYSDLYAQRVGAFGDSSLEGRRRAYMYRRRSSGSAIHRTVG